MYIWIHVFIYIYMVAWALVCIDSIQIDGGPSLLMGVVGAEKGNHKRLQNAYVTRIA